MGLFEKRQYDNDFLKWTIYLAIALILYTLQNTPNFLQICGVSPILLIGFCVSVAMLEKEVAAGFFGIMSGVLWDLSSGELFGFNAIILFILAVVISLLVNNILRCSLINNLVLAVFAVATQLLFYYFFFYWIWGYENSHVFLLNHLIPVGVYSFLCSPIIFLIMKKIATKFNGEYV